MRLISIAACLSASALAFAAHAQVADPATSPAPAGPALSQPPAPPAPSGNVPPPAPPAPPAPSAQAPLPSPQAYNAAATPPGAIMEMGPAQPVIQSAPQPTGDYPRCTKTLRDACTNTGSR